MSNEEAGSLGPLLRPRAPGAEDDEATVKVGAPPAELAGVLDSVLVACSRRDVEPRITGHAGSGVTFVALPGAAGEEAQAGVIEELREIRVRRGGSVVVPKAPVSLKRRVEVWGPAGDHLELSRRVKEKFDPRGVLNPGRFVGGI